jgi:hypothetical protein
MARAHNIRVINQEVPAFQPLTGVYEPSAIHQLPDGHFHIVEDETEHPLSLATIGADGKVKTAALTASLLQMFSSFWKRGIWKGRLRTRRVMSTPSPRTRAMTTSTKRSRVRNWFGFGSKVIGSWSPRSLMG